ncbi:MAG TPA: hypothetical protein VMQ63_02915 [Stellaceae bacterium]|jgi:ElaB/YqjD/DUF883 family membrane-anchored ribosome-binding protein|nr:hypothetical protein [Stellaceae bacterium]
MADGSSKSKTHDSDLDTVRDDVSSLKHDLAKLLDHVKSGTLEGLSGTVDGVSDEARRQAEKLAKHVEEKPLSSVLIAFGIGFLSGRLLLR